ncbi:hypothetical protein B0H19DRAFT_134034 [Mycena capillaripes]|nr:hypothetical protein B0H19DRAFT_134034 [Mycena capillaripes]
MAQERITIMKYYESVDYVSFKAFGSLQCGNIYRKCNLMCCSASKRQCYCSKRCQSADWKDGHRGACSRMVSLTRVSVHKGSVISPCSRRPRLQANSTNYSSMGVGLYGRISRPIPLSRFRLFKRAAPVQISL